MCAGHRPVALHSHRVYLHVLRHPQSRRCCPRVWYSLPGINPALQLPLPNPIQASFNPGTLPRFFNAPPLEPVPTDLAGDATPVGGATGDPARVQGRPDFEPRIADPVASTGVQPVPVERPGAPSPRLPLEV